MSEATLRFSKTSPRKATGQAPHVPLGVLQAFTDEAVQKLPVALYHRPAHGYSFAELAGDHVEAALDQLLAGVAKGKRDVAGSYLIYGLTFAAKAIFLAPLILDGVVLSVSPDAMGVEFDSDGWVAASWLIEAMQAALPFDPVLTGPNHRERMSHLVGHALRELFDPIEANLKTRTRLPISHLHNYVVDSMAGHVIELERLHAVDVPSYLPGLMKSLEPRTRKPARIIRIERADKPDIKAVMWRTCCLSHKLDTDHLCPSCPRYPSDEARKTAILCWRSQHEEDRQ